MSVRTTVKPGWYHVQDVYSHIVTYVNELGYHEFFLNMGVKSNLEKIKQYLTKETADYIRNNSFSLPAEMLIYTTAGKVFKTGGYLWESYGLKPIEIEPPRIPESDPGLVLDIID